MANDSSENIGIVIDAHSIIAVQARIVNGRVEVISRGKIETPPGAVDGAVIEDPERVAQALRNLVRDMGARSRTASAALISPGYTMRTVRLPEVPPAERRALVRGEMEELGALQYGAGAFDFLWVPLRSEGGKRQADAHTYYASDAEVDSLRETLRMAGLLTARIEPASLAIMRAYLLSQLVPQPIALICPAEKHTDLCIHDGKMVQSVRRIPSGWQDIVPSAKIENSLFYTAGNDTETRPSQYDMPSPLAKWPSAHSPRESDPSDAAGPSAQESPENGESGSLTQHSAAFLASEIARSLAFYAREYPAAAKPQALAILGPASIVQILTPLLEKSLPLPIQSQAPLAAFSMAPPATASPEVETGDYATAIGVALAGTENTIPVVDLAHLEDQALARKRAPAVLLAGMAGSTLWMLIAAVASISLFFMESNAQGERIRIAQEIAKVKAARAPLLARAEASAAANAAAAKTQLPVAPVLGRVAASAQPGIMLTRLSVSPDGKVGIEGNALNTVSMQQFALDVGRGISIKYPTFEIMKQDDKGGLSFRIVGATRASGSADSK
ncbi:MAG: type pilus assembly protein PilM [Chthonomonadaceae bacterium]|nr:type pilus assembly protein PilM [Chthonomonadaceae bacterium]